MASNLLAPWFKTITASGAITTTTTSSAFALPIGADTYTVIFNWQTVTGTSPTADVVLQSTPDAGTTYVNLPIRSTQVTLAGVTHFIFKLGLGNNEVALESPAASTGGTLAKNCLFDPTKMKYKVTIGGTNPSFTFTVFGGATAKDQKGSA